MASLLEATPMEPKIPDLGGLPHITYLPFPWTGILECGRAQAPTLTHLVCNVLRDKRGCPCIHIAPPCRIHDEVCFHFASITYHHRACLHLLHFHPALQLDLPIDHKLGGAHIHIETRPTPIVHGENARMVLSKSVHKTGLLKALIERLVHRCKLLVERGLQAWEQLVRAGGQ
ncbi:hypothetical protein GOP47_0030975 [Adiantum capillus-veneris]|nr:hypothetical protein GOP47_0030975 [Adiantum capillus-veneris]